MNIKGMDKDMSRYINITELGVGKCNPDLFNDKGYAEGWNTAIDIIEKTPTAEVQPVKFGEWVEYKDYYNHGWVCSACGNYGHENKEGRPCFSEFCPNCGADMRNDEKVINQL
jgi:hypothetical protein